MQVLRSPLVDVRMRSITHDLGLLWEDIARSSKKSNNNLTDAALEDFPKTREFVEDLDMPRQGNMSSID